MHVHGHTCTYLGAHSSSCPFWDLGAMASPWQGAQLPKPDLGFSLLFPSPGSMKKSKKPGHLGKMTDSQDGVEMVHDGLEACCVRK